MQTHPGSRSTAWYCASAAIGSKSRSLIPTRVVTSCQATQAELEDTSAYLVALRMEKSRKSTQPATDGKEDEAES